MFKGIETYFVNVWDALLGRDKKREHFTNSSKRFVGVSIVVFLLVIIFSFQYAYGAAKLSYCYNTSIGNAQSAFLWSFLAFFFSGFYYPYYALFLNPLCVTGGRVGGRR